MKRLASLTVTILALLLATLVFVPSASAQNPQEECGANTFLVKLDNIPDLDPGEQYTGTATGTDGVSNTITVRFNGPNDYTLISSVPALPAGAIFVAKFGNGGGLSHVTVCIPPAVTPTPVTPTPVTPTPVTPTPETPTPVTPTATDVPPTATTVPGEPTPTHAPPTATTVPGEPTKVPTQPEPTKAAPGVTALPSTGSDGGASGGGQGLVLLAAAAATLMAGAGVILTNHSRGRQQR
jgi:hypothetical protein